MTTTATDAPRPGRPRNPQLRANILAAALELFSEQGYDATSVSEVVVRAGVTKGALYHYFSKKEDLLYEIYRALLDEQLAGLDRATDQPQADVALRAAVENLVVTTTTHIKAVVVFTRETARLSSERWQALQADWRRYQKTLRTIIRDGQDAGLFDKATSPELASWMISGFAVSLQNWYRADGAKTPEVVAQEAADFFLKALRAGVE